MSISVLITLIFKMSSDGGTNKQLVDAMSIISLTNICFKNCVMKNDPSVLS